MQTAVFHLWRTTDMSSQRIASSVWREHVAQWRASGASAQAYADQHGLPATRFNYWI